MNDKKNGDLAEVQTRKEKKAQQRNKNFTVSKTSKVVEPDLKVNRINLNKDLSDGNRKAYEGKYSTKRSQNNFVKPRVQRFTRIQQHTVNSTIDQAAKTFVQP